MHRQSLTVQQSPASSSLLLGCFSWACVPSKISSLCIPILITSQHSNGHHLLSKSLKPESNLLGTPGILLATRRSVLFSPPFRRGGKPKGLPGLTLGLPTVGAAWLGLALDSRAASLNLWVETPMGCLRYLYYWFVTVTKQSQLQSSNEISLWLGVRAPRNCFKGCSINKVLNLCSRGYSPSWLPQPLFPHREKLKPRLQTPVFCITPFKAQRLRMGLK